MKRKPPSEDDLVLMEEFSASFDLDEIDFDEWAKVHATLDLAIDIKITKEEAQKGGSRVLSFSRTLHGVRGKSQTDQKSREKCLKTVTWAKGTPESIWLTYPDEGDVRGNMRGHLKVHLIVMK